MKPTRPAIRYHGGKWKLGPWVISHFVEHQTYVETHGGGASVLMQKDRSEAEIYNDIDGEIVNFFQVLRDRPAELSAAIHLTPFAMDEYRLSFKRSRNPVEQARRTAVRAYMGFGSNSLSRKANTSFRTNSNDRGTSSASEWMNLPPHVLRAAERFRGVIIDNRPAEKIIVEQDGPHTLFYVDPTYLHSTRSNKKKKQADGYTHEMTDEQHVELAKVLYNVQGMVLISGYPSGLYQELYKGWECDTMPVKAFKGADRMECLWMNATLSKHADRHRLFAGMPT